MNEKTAKEITEAFRCAKCGEGDASRRSLIEFNPQMILGSINDLIAITCRNCSYTELYKPDMLTGRDDRAAVLAKIFG